VNENDWNLLGSRFIGTASDSNDPQWDEAAYLSSDNKSVHEYNMEKLRSLQKPNARLNAEHNVAEARWTDSQEANGLHATLFLCEDADVMFTSNLWTAAGLHNGAKGKVVDFVYTTPDGPRSGSLPKSVVVQFPHLDETVDAFLPGLPKTVSIPTIQVEWSNTAGKVYTRKQFSLMLSWAFTIHKSQGKTFDRAVIDLGKREMCSGMTLVALSRVRRLSDLLFKPFSYERLEKVNKSGGLAALREAMDRLRQKNQQDVRELVE
jgi:ATP-dependent DNA helicase PIF1